METYIIQIIIFQLIFWLFYEAFLRRETFFNANRAYLLVSSVLSLLLPFVKLSFFAKTVPALQKALAVQLPEILIGYTEVVSQEEVVSTSVVKLVPATSSWFSLELIWHIGIGICAVLLLYKLSKIYYYKYSNPNQWKGNYLLVWIKNSKEAFSFFNQIFLGDQIDEIEQASILKHEKVHANEWHSLDLLWFELLRMVFWFNPLVYIYQKRITEVHEYLADKAAAKHQENYYEDLLAQTFGVTHFSLINQFYSSSLIKKRIIMLTKEKSKSIKKLKYLAVLPIVLSMLFYVSCSEVETQEIKENMTLTEGKVIKDVINIVEEVLPASIESSKEITESQYDQLRSRLQSYYLESKSDIDKIDIIKYSTMAFSLDLMSDGEYTNEEENLRAFALTDTPVNMLINKEKTEYNFDFIKNMAVYLRKDKLKMVERLKGLNFKLPNEEEWIAMYEKVRAKVEANTGDLDVPFAILEKSPIYPGCDKNATREELKKCFSKKIAQHVNENFNVKIGKENNLIGLQRIAVAFKIDKEGNIIEVRVRAPHKSLVTEANRVMSLLPKMKPGIHKGKAVTVPYALPIKFKIN